MQEECERMLFTSKADYSLERVKLESQRPTETESGAFVKRKIVRPCLYLELASTLMWSDLLPLNNQWDHLIERDLGWVLPIQEDRLD